MPARMTSAGASSTATRRVHGLLWLGAAILLACHFALSLQQSGKTFLDVGAYTHYEEKRPYQYRLLMAPVVGGLMRLASLPAATALLAKLPTYVSTPEAAAYLVINVVGFAASCLLMAAIARRTMAGPGAVRLAMAIYVALAYLFFCLNPNVPFILPYDVPALALSLACLLCILDRRWRWLYPLFALATLNRETSFLVVVFLAARVALGHDAKRSFGHVAALSALWLAIKLGLYLGFSALPSDEGLRIVHNLGSLLKPWQWPALLPLLASAGLSFASLRSVPSARAWAFTGCAGFALIFAVGQLTETRAFADLIVFFTLAITPWLLRTTADPTQKPE